MRVSEDELRVREGETGREREGEGGRGILRLVLLLLHDLVVAKGSGMYAQLPTIQNSLVIDLKYSNSFDQ